LTGSPIPDAVGSIVIGAVLSLSSPDEPTLAV
jgi:hypothetical protein